MFNIINGHKQGDALSLLLFNVTLEYVSRKAGKNRLLSFHYNAPNLLLTFGHNMDIGRNNIMDIRATFNGFGKSADSVRLEIRKIK